MSARVIAAGMTQAVIDAARIMRDEDIGALPVIEDGRLVGILTDRDVVVRAVAEDVDPHTACVGDIASSDIVCVRPGQAVEHALQVMATHHIRRVPVVDDEYRVVGTVAQVDIARTPGLNQRPRLPVSGRTWNASSATATIDH